MFISEQMCAFSACFDLVPVADEKMTSEMVMGLKFSVCFDLDGAVLLQSLMRRQLLRW